MNTDMIIDTETFDFMSIDDGDAVSPPIEEVADEELDDDADDLFGHDEDDSEYDDEDEDFDDEEESAGDKFDKDLSLATFSENFDAIPDDQEFHIGGETFTKQMMTEAVQTRKVIDATREQFQSYVANISQIEERNQAAINFASTEVEGRLRAVNDLLKNPEQLTPGDLQKAYTAKVKLEQRYSELESAVQSIREAESQRKEQACTLRIQRANLEMQGEKDWRGIESIRELNEYAQSKGISPNVLYEGMSADLLRVFRNAKAWEDQQTKNKTAITNAMKSKAPRSISGKKKASAPANKAVRSARARSYEAAIKNGDATAAFNLLED